MFFTPSPFCGGSPGTKHNWKACWSSPAVFISWLSAQQGWRWFMLVTAWILQSSHRELLLARLQPRPETSLDTQHASRISSLWTCIHKADGLFGSACLSTHSVMKTAQHGCSFMTRHWFWYLLDNIITKNKCEMMTQNVQVSVTDGSSSLTVFPELFYTVYMCDFFCWLSISPLHRRTDLAGWGPDKQLSMKGEEVH